MTTSPPIIIFGIGDMGRIAHFYFTHDTPYDVAAFTVDRNYIDSETFEGLPLLPFEEIEKHYSPEHYQAYVAVGYSGVNKIRAQKYQEAKNKGYKLVSYVSSKATCWTQAIGDNCFILEDNTLQPFVTIGNNVTLWSGNHVGHDAVIEDHCFITSHVVLSGHVHVEPYCFLGVNATVRNNIRIAAKGVIGAGAVIVKDTEAGGVYTGVAAQKREQQSSEQLTRI